MGAALVTAGPTLDAPILCACECGKVRLKISEGPIIKIKCHCKNCYAFRSMKNTKEKGELDTKHPVAGIFRSHAVEITKGEEEIAYKETRGQPPLFFGVKRGYCSHCKTPGVIECIRDLPYRIIMGDVKFVYLGYCLKDPPQDFAFHMSYDTATNGAKRLCDGDGKRKVGTVVGQLLVIGSLFANSKVLAALVICGAAIYSQKSSHS